jgi:hypothetical protein
MINNVIQGIIIVIIPKKTSVLKAINNNITLSKTMRKDFSQRSETYAGNWRIN